MVLVLKMISLAVCYQVGVGCQVSGARQGQLGRQQASNPEGRDGQSRCATRWGVGKGWGT